MQSVDQDLQLFKNGITNEIFSKNYGIILFDVSGTQNLSIVWTGTVHLHCTFAKPLTESIVLISLNQFETYWEVIPDGSVLLDLNTNQ